jgi:drug/metabolite transporter (DMT)-like permease
VTPRKYLVLLGIILFGVTGDSLLSHGMKLSGSISLQHLSSIVLVVLNPWIAAGILFLLCFFASYMVSLSWADLTYVLPATSFGYILLTLIAKFVLHENVTWTRWLGILFISAGVGFVTQGPALTHKPPPEEPESERALEEAVASRSGR